MEALPWLAAAGSAQCPSRVLFQLRSWTDLTTATGTGTSSSAEESTCHYTVSAEKTGVPRIESWAISVSGSGICLERLVGTWRLWNKLWHLKSLML